MKGLAVALMVVGVLAAAGGAVGVATKGGGTTGAVVSPTLSASLSPPTSLSPSPFESVSPPAPAESVRDFLASLAQAVRSKDQAFLLARLHPAVIALYGQQQCETFVSTLSDPTRAFRVRSVSALGQYNYNPDGTSTVVQDVYTVRVRVTANGQTAVTDVHLGLVDGQIRWFTDCGTPQ